MAEEQGGVCFFKPGAYVIEYTLRDATSSCGDVDALPDEFLTVTRDGQMVGTSDATPTGCNDGNPVVNGCFVWFTRVCNSDSVDGRVEATIGAQFWYDAGEGQLTLTGRLYSGTTLLDSCVVNMDATIRRR